ncbi:hypothetical protein Q7P37_002140 [Cladosporium fusiforme]
MAMVLCLPPTSRPSNSSPEPPSTTPDLVAHEDRYPCTLCSEHFKGPSGRVQHMKEAHDVDEGWLCHECPSCNHKDSAPDALERHREQDHVDNGSHQPQCPECKFRNESVVGVSVHFLHEHSPEVVERRKAALKAEQAAAKFERHIANLRAQREAEAEQAAEASSSAEGSSSSAPSTPEAEQAAAEASYSAEGSSSSAPSTPEEPAARVPVVAGPTSSDRFLAAQLAALTSMSEEGQTLALGRHSDRRNARRRHARRDEAAGSST